MFGIDTLQVGVVQLQYSTVLCCCRAGWGVLLRAGACTGLPGDTDIQWCRFSRAQGPQQLRLHIATLVSSE